MKHILFHILSEMKLKNDMFKSLVQSHTASMFTMYF